MLIAAYVSQNTELHLRRLLIRQAVTFARSWADLDAVVRATQVGKVIIEPCADGAINRRAAIKFVRGHPKIDVLAYVTPTAENLKVVFELSKNGLEEVFVHPLAKSDLRFARTLEASGGRQLGNNLLATFERKLGALPPSVFAVVRDVFRRPYRYRSARDIAVAACLPRKTLYSCFKRQNLPTPRRLLVVAKATHAYGYLHYGKKTVPWVTRRLGYPDVRSFSRHLSRVFGCRTSVFATNIDPEEVFLDLVESMSKPLAHGCAGSPK